MADAGAETRPESAMVALVEEVEIHVSQRRHEAIWITALPMVSVREMEAEPVVDGEFRIDQEAGEEALLDRFERQRSTVRRQAVDANRVGMVSADHHATLSCDSARVSAQYAVGVVMFAREEAFYGLFVTRECSDEFLLFIPDFVTHLLLFSVEFVAQ
jgi:hypothetical protein